MHAERLILFMASASPSEKLQVCNPDLAAVRQFSHWSSPVLSCTRHHVGLRALLPVMDALASIGTAADTVFSYRLCRNTLAADPSARRAIAKIGKDKGAVE
jgi:hypothetical protein